MLSIVKIFHYEASYSLILTLLGTVIGSGGIATGLGLIATNILKCLPAVNVFAMCIDSGIAFVITAALGLAFLGIVRSLYIEGKNFS